MFIDKAARLAISALASVFILHSLGLPSAHASLGGKLDSIESDRKAFEGRLAAVSTPAPSQGYSVHEIVQDGTKIQEYALPNGTVFAVTWRGPTQPDLSVLLGHYFDEYLGSLQSLNRSTERPSGRTARRRGRAARVIRSKNTVVERSGHMRDIRGKAYLPKLMPEGLQPEDIHG